MLDEDEVGDRDVMVGIDVPRERRQRPVRHPHRQRRRVLERVGHREEQTFMNGLQNSCGGRSLLYARARGCDSLPMFRANVRFGSKADMTFRCG